MKDFTLSRREQAFAAVHHRLIFAFLNEAHLPEQEYYGIAAMGFLAAVHLYLNKPGLERFAFSTVACRSMRSYVADYRRAVLRQKRCGEVIGLETGDIDRLPAQYQSPSAEDVLLRELEETMLLHCLAWELPTEQYELVLLRLSGLGIREIAAKRQVSEKSIRRLLRQIRAVFQDVCQSS